MKETGRAKWQKKACLPPPAEAVTIYFSQVIKNKAVQEMLCMNFFYFTLDIILLASRMEENKIKIMTPSIKVHEQSKIQI